MCYYKTMNNTEQNPLETYIKNIIYFDAKENEWKDGSNAYGILESFLAIRSSQKQDYNVKSYEVIEKSGFMAVAWHIGGATGGNCWGNEAEKYIVEHPTPLEFTLMEKVLEDVCPNLTYKQYKQIVSQLDIKEDTTGNYEYYGNRTEYFVRYFPVKNLVQAIEKLDTAVDYEFIKNMNETFEKKKIEAKNPTRKLKV